MQKVHKKYINTVPIEKFRIGHSHYHKKLKEISLP